MAKSNSYGEVALGQEGLGLAQVLTPYDATKFGTKVIAAKDAQKKADAKEAEKIKPMDFDPAKAAKSWYEIYGEKSAEKFHNLGETYVDLTIETSAVNLLSDPYEKKQRTAELNKKISMFNVDKANYEDETIQQIAQKDLWTYEKNAYKANPDNFTEKSGVNIDRFIDMNSNEYQEALKKTNGDEVAARNTVLRAHGNSLLEPKADIGKFVNFELGKTRQQLQDYGKEYLPTEIGEHYISTGVDGKKYISKNKIINGVLTDLYGVNGLLTTLIEDPLYRFDVLAFTGKEHITDVTKDEAYNYFAESPKGKAFVETLVAPEFAKYTVSANEINKNAGGGGADEVVLNSTPKSNVATGQMQTKVAGIYSATTNVSTSVSAIESWGIGKSNINSKEFVPTKNTTSTKGEVPKYGLTLNSDFEVNKIPVAKESFEFKFGGTEYKIIKGAKIPDVIFNDPNFDAGNLQYIGYDWITHGTYIDRTYDTAKSFDLITPLSDVEHLLKPEAVAKIRGGNGTQGDYDNIGNQ